MFSESLTPELAEGIAKGALSLGLDKIKHWVNANNPYALILFSIGSAMDTGIKVRNELSKTLKGYNLETKQDQQRIMIFIFQTSFELFG